MKQILKQLIELRSEEPQEQVFIEAAYLMRDANDIALENGLDIEPVGTYITPAKAIAAVNRFLAAMEPERYLLVKDAAKILSVSQDKVSEWINANRLEAVNVANPGKRPQYRIPMDALRNLKPERKYKPRYL